MASVQIVAAMQENIFEFLKIEFLIRFVKKKYKQGKFLLNLQIQSSLANFLISLNLSGCFLKGFITRLR